MNNILLMYRQYNVSLPIYCLQNSYPSFSLGWSTDEVKFSDSFNIGKTLSRRLLYLSSISS